ncbi:MAG: YtxH domain-containing protein [Gammaproteobacteria bacterium]|nr:YtxH domain-containing protein [Gammaproteobacteria bacterium]
METHTEEAPGMRGGQGGSRILTFVGGLAVGYVAATLLAPKAGRELRSNLSSYAKTTSSNVSSAMRDVIDSARQATRSMGRKMMSGAEGGHEKEQGVDAGGAASEGAGQKNYQ